MQQGTKLKISYSWLLMVMTDVPYRVIKKNEVYVALRTPFFQVELCRGDFVDFNISLTVSEVLCW